MLFKIALLKTLHAKGTSKVLWMEFLSHSIDTLLSDRLLALEAERPSGCVVVELAIWVSLVFKEVHLWERLQAGLTGEAVGMPIGTHSREVATHYSLGAPLTCHSKFVKVVFFAICLSIFFKEVQVVFIK
jgi:hypothetical protein